MFAQEFLFKEKKIFLENYHLMDRIFCLKLLNFFFLLEIKLFYKIKKFLNANFFSRSKDNTFSEKRITTLLCLSLTVKET